MTGRVYKPYEYVGAPDADKVVVVMGSGSQAVETAEQFLNANGHKVGVLKVRRGREAGKELPAGKGCCMRALLPAATRLACSR